LGLHEDGSGLFYATDMVNMHFDGVQKWQSWSVLLSIQQKVNKHFSALTFSS